WMTDDGILPDQAGREAAKHLHFFTPHDVGAVLADMRNARNDRFTFSRPHERLCELADSCGRWHVGSFFPATVGANHPGEQHREIAKSLTDFGHSARKTSRRDRHYAFVVLELVDALAGSVD